MSKSFVEVPSYLKNLYRHWHVHASHPIHYQKTNLEQTVLTSMVEFAAERMSVWERRQLDGQPPFTKDPILNKYRFCNIYRELDRQTIALHELLNPLRDNFSLWLLNLIFARMVCNPETSKQVGLLSFNHQQNQAVMQKLLKLPRPKYGTAYVFPISVIQHSDYPTRESFFCLYLPQVAAQCAQAITQFSQGSVVDILSAVLPIFGFNFRFHWTEILIDVAYQSPEYVDLYKMFPVGPGSAPTMLKLNSTQGPQITCLQLVHQQIESFPYLTYNNKPLLLSTENWEGIGCEFRKYTNLQQGHGRVRRYT
jgi:hypothetical protein